MGGRKALGEEIIWGQKAFKRPGGGKNQLDPDSQTPEGAAAYAALEAEVGEITGSKNF